jgi:hypothetical protein
VQGIAEVESKLGANIILLYLLQFTEGLHHNIEFDAVLSKLVTASFVAPQ